MTRLSRSIATEFEEALTCPPCGHSPWEVETQLRREAPPLQQPPRVPLTVVGEASGPKEIERYRRQAGAPRGRPEDRGRVPYALHAADLDEYHSAEGLLQPESQSFAAFANTISNETGYCYETWTSPVPC